MCNARKPSDLHLYILAANRIKVQWDVENGKPQGQGVVHAPTDDDQMPIMQVLLTALLSAFIS
jgi:hypothetical protein